ncbi:Acylamino-acid-releasing enzyme [Acropora cervicornis]|uniref:Acylamino-acid-releasing enzyme n=1 Tax=Acropora cervicornis TaxID=6130 RepID=A0AAD9PXZ1_ACRCE|nr:Acylamino-acid-releasing enzyme [Acropora cervicornis]
MQETKAPTVMFKTTTTTVYCNDSNNKNENGSDSDNNNNIYDWKAKTTSTIVDVVDIPEKPGCWTFLDMMAALPDVIAEDGLTWTVVDIQDEYEAVFQKPVTTSGKKPKLIVMPHGGPHVNFNSNFSLYNACLCKLGFAVLGVNFRGSLAFGQKPLHSLPGKIGTQDVQDVQVQCFLLNYFASFSRKERLISLYGKSFVNTLTSLVFYAAKKVLESGEVDDTNVFVMGGSHGGFLTAHLIGQYPGWLKCQIYQTGKNIFLSHPPRRNWQFSQCFERGERPKVKEENGEKDGQERGTCYFEGGFNFTHQSTPTPEVLAKLLQVSPYAYFSEAKGVETRLLWYPGNNHPLSKVDAESDVFVNLARWFFEHAQK